MKAIKITAANAAQIESALKAINGTAYAHSFTSAAEIDALVEAAEAACEKTLLSQKDLVGAQFSATSGDKVSNAYAKKCRTRVATRVVLERRSTGWLLISAEKAAIYQQGGAQTIWLNQEQTEKAARRFASQFGLLLAAA